MNWGILQGSNDTSIDSPTSYTITVDGISCQLGGIYQTTPFNVSQSWNISFSYSASTHNTHNFTVADGFALGLFTQVPDLSLQGGCIGGNSPNVQFFANPIVISNTANLAVKNEPTVQNFLTMAVNIAYSTLAVGIYGGKGTVWGYSPLSNTTSAPESNITYLQIQATFEKKPLLSSAFEVD